MCVYERDTHMYTEQTSPGNKDLINKSQGNLVNTWIRFSVFEFCDQKSLITAWDVLFGVEGDFTERIGNFGIVLKHIRDKLLVIHEVYCVMAWSLNPLNLVI